MIGGLDRKNKNENTATRVRRILSPFLVYFHSLTMSNTKDPKNNNTDVDGDEEDTQDQTPQSAEDKKLNAGLTQEREEREADAATAQQAIQRLQQELAAANVKSTKLTNDPSIEIKKEDVQFLMNELELNKEQAETLLRQNKGALMSAIRTFLAQ
jgi:NACalpha-BTF3-like transcription factor